MRAVAILAGLLALAALLLPAPSHSQAAPARPPAKTAYLTFDDGPDPRWTPRVLEILRRHDARATFFTIGSAVDAHPRLARRIVRDGHSIGNHTYGHVDIGSVSAFRFYEEVDRTQAAIRRATGVTTRWLRPPFGSISAHARQLARERGYRVVMWDVDPQDWRRPGATRIAAEVLTRTRPGATILLHDGGGDRSQTVAALETVLRTLSARGYTFEALR